jgi:hypothetical protein
LGEEDIGGLRALGFRKVRAYGKDKHEFLIQEEWFSPEYAINLRYIILRSYPDMKTTTETLNVVDGEPDPALFQVPPGYAIVDEDDISSKPSKPQKSP